MKKLKLAILGDLSLTGSFERKVRYNKEIFSSEILSILKDADHCICNLEGPVTNYKNIIGSTSKITNPPNSISYLAKRNITIFNLANNHIFDYGKSGYMSTLTEIENNDCLHFGSWLTDTEVNNSILIGNKKNVRLTSFTEKTKQKEKSIQAGTLSELNILKQTKEHWNIILHHGGEEYSLYPSPTKRKLLKKIQKKYNPNFLISHHSHTLQGLEKVGKTNIFYSLGNFVFDIKPHHLYKYTNESVILMLMLKDKEWSYELVPIRIDRNNGKIETGSETIIQRFNVVSNFSDYRNKWRRDAYRSLVERLPTAEEDQNERPLHKKSGLELFLSFNFYKKTLKIIFDNNNRSIYWNALIYKLFYKNDRR